MGLTEAVVVTDPTPSPERLMENQGSGGEDRGPWAWPPRAGSVG